ncbi:MULTISPECIES: O-antigen ligase family protein [Burkholderia]|uniref:O-antigen ligase family protein n=2 Tax=Burkholderia cepacia complex TaxID=87882 RepID=A0AAP1YB16_9BURK|nr:MULTISPECIES: O-antigen ligase family protein [Burkholderia]MBK1902174.1 O-antigen ligase family protein [Burkholderia contaminans]MBK1910457.1 O-antigen ligase family protein [Burkholderia contaminans]MBK1923916.1 O-antigen ligase family protein [Burkholderia contaminans]MBK1932128.1 O-antigen ligase family protein [Burkholderia contaminans]MBK1939377.1 O-antigen ligase family protein [Burkholderia contaminans]
MLPLSFPVSRRLTVARACAVAALCMVPVSTALTNVFCALFAVALIASPEFWGNLRLSVSNGASLAALLLLGALVLSINYTIAPHEEAWSWVGKYEKLLLLPFAVIAFRSSGWESIVSRAWFATLCVILLLSTTNYLGLTAIGPAHASALPVSRAWVFKNHIAAGMFGALLFYQAADLALAASTLRWRVSLAAIAGLSLLNVFVMLQGRTGQIIALLLVFVVVVRLVLAQYRRSPLRAGLSAGSLLTLAAVLVAIACTMHGGRLVEVAAEVREYRQSDAVTSSGLRLEWYKKSLELFRARPLIGYGVAGLEYEFSRLGQGKTAVEAALTKNPHNEYLLMAVQLGAVGVLLFLNLIVQIARGGRKLDPRSRHLLLAWLAIFAIGSLANSLLLDFAEGHLLVLLGGILLGCGTAASKVTDSDDDRGTAVVQPSP